MNSLSGISTVDTWITFRKLVGQIGMGRLLGDWDPKEMWSLASRLVYLSYFHFRYMYGRKHPRINSFWLILGLFVIIITLLWVNLSGIFTGLHSYAA